MIVEQARGFMEFMRKLMKNVESFQVALQPSSRAVP